MDSDILGDVQRSVARLVQARPEWRAAIDTWVTARSLVAALEQSVFDDKTLTDIDHSLLSTLKECEAGSPTRVAAGTGPALMLLVEAGPTTAFPSDALRVTDGTATLSVDFCRLGERGSPRPPEPEQWIVCLGYAVWVGTRAAGGLPAVWIEVETWSVLLTTPKPPPRSPPSQVAPAVTVSKVEEAVRAIKDGRTINVVGEVTAISPILPMKGVCVFFVELAERTGQGINSVTTVVFKQVPMQLHSRFEMRRRALITGLKPTTLFKDQPALRRDLLKASSKTTVIAVDLDTELMPPPAPPLRARVAGTGLSHVPGARKGDAARASQDSERKRRRVEVSEENAPTAAPSAHVPEIEQAVCGRVVPCYTGTVTRAVHHGAMLYELDGTVLLLCSHYHTVSCGRQLRVGNTLRVHNAHVVRGAVTPPHLGVLGCCIRTSIDIVSCGDKRVPCQLANVSPLLMSVSKEMTLSRFHEFLPTCDAVAAKFGRLPPGTLQQLIDALRRGMLFPRMTRPRNIYAEFYDHGLSCDISRDPNPREVVDQPLVTACSKIPQIAELQSLATLALLSNADGAWGKTTICRFDDETCPGLLIGSLRGSRRGELELCDGPGGSSMAALVEHVEPHHLDMTWVFLRYSLCTERVQDANDTRVRTSILTRFNERECRRLVSDDSTRVEEDAGSASAPAGPGFRDLPFFVTEKRIRENSRPPSPLAVSGVLLYGVASVPGANLVVPDMVHTTEKVTLVFVESGSKWYPTVRPGRLYFLRHVSTKTTVAGSAVHVTVTAADGSEVCAVGIDSAEHLEEAKSWSAALWLARASVETDSLVWLGAATVARLSKVLEDAVNKCSKRCDSVAVALARAAKSHAQSTASLQGRVVGRTNCSFNDKPAVSVRIEDCESPDVTTLYVDVDRFSLPLGLVVGATVQARYVERRASKATGNYYFVVLPCTELVATTALGQHDVGNDHHLEKQRAAVPRRNLYYYSTAAGRSNRALGKFWCSVTAVWHLTCSWTCAQCGDTGVVLDECRGTCDTSWHVFKADARMEIQDGTAVAELFVSEPDLVWQLLGADPASVAKIKAACRVHGDAEYSSAAATRTAHDGDGLLRGIAKHRAVQFMGMVARPVHKADPTISTRTVLKQTTQTESKPVFEAVEVHRPSALLRAQQLMRALSKSA